MKEEEILYQIVAIGSELKKGYPEEITTILKNGYTGKTYTNYDFKNHRYLYCYVSDNFNIYDRLEEKDKEINRLKNDLINLLRIIDKNCDDLEGTEEEFDSLDRTENLLKELKEGNNG